MMNVCIVAGARPNFIKVAPLIRAIKAHEDMAYQLVYAGTADDPTLEQTLFDDLKIARPDVFLGADCTNLNELTGRVMAAFERYLAEHATDVVVVVDDLASTMAAAIVTKKQGICLAHLVAGTRSFDINMPKEINRLVIDGLSDLLFTAGISASSIANREGAEQSRVFMVGNILIDNLRFNHTRWQRPAVADELGLAEGRYLVFTLNRKALLANRENLGLMVQAMAAAAADMPIVAPLRERAAEVVREVAPHARLLMVNPLGYLQFGWLTAHAAGIVTDSGNVAEEATFNGVPCATLNSYTEHIETVKQGSNVLVGEDADRLRQAVADMVEGRWKKCALPERWDGRTAERIVQILKGTAPSAHEERKSGRGASLLLALLFTLLTFGTAAHAQGPLTKRSDGTVVVNTTSLAADVKGYMGPTPLEIHIQKGKIVKVDALKNSETPKYFARVKKNLLPKWAGMKVSKALKTNMDGVTGATYSSDAVKENVRRGLNYWRASR